jgi:hypothetical protein
VGLLNKSACLAAAPLGVTKFITMIGMNLVTLLVKSDLGVQQTGLSLKKKNSHEHLNILIKSLAILTLFILVATTTAAVAAAMRIPPPTTTTTTRDT